MCDPSGSSQAMPSLSGASTVLPALSFWIAIANRFAAHSTIRLPSSKPAVFRRRKAFLLCKNPCGGTAVGMGSPSQSTAAPPAQRNFQRKFALRRVGSSKSIVPPTIERSKVRNNARLEKFLYRAAPGCQRDRGPSVSGSVQRNPFQGVPLGNFFLTVDAVLLCAAKKNGVETTRLAGHCQSTPGACRHGRQQKLTVPPSQRQTPPAGGNSPAKPPARSCLPAHTAPCRASSPDILPGRDENHS